MHHLCGMCLLFTNETTILILAYQIGLHFTYSQQDGVYRWCNRTSTNAHHLDINFGIAGGNNQVIEMFWYWLAFSNSWTPESSYSENRSKDFIFPIGLEESNTKIATSSIHDYLPRSYKYKA
ncbi:hypothetical protein CSKR_200333 [Clonorchis sinensis]|uniref:Uncharacterized protein n=1 Tax=Clonorchis sinensis TaxID=79923 RepID=A0A8T1MDX4_CLOSI|nr:hypothetical protein CSKR_200333 [Clonorchis sinensis]